LASLVVEFHDTRRFGVAKGIGQGFPRDAKDLLHNLCLKGIVSAFAFRDKLDRAMTIQIAREPLDGGYQLTVRELLRPQPADSIPPFYNGPVGGGQRFLQSFCRFV
jgi:hypothetical protein